MTLIECLGHGAQDIHVHVYRGKRALGVWNVSRQRAEKKLKLTRRLTDCLAAHGLLVEGNV